MRVAVWSFWVSCTEVFSKLTSHEISLSFVEVPSNKSRVPTRPADVRIDDDATQLADFIKDSGM